MLVGSTATIMCSLVAGKERGMEERRKVERKGLERKFASEEKERKKESKGKNKFLLWQRRREE